SSSSLRGSREMVNAYLDDQQDLDPTVLIPANGRLLQDLQDRWQVQVGGDPFYLPPEPIVSTILVGISWPERGEALFPDDRFDWDRLVEAMSTGRWGAIGEKEWGSFDFVITDPTRSNSGQLTLALAATHALDLPRLPSATEINVNSIEALIALMKRSVYLPPRSTDILLREFIARGPNDADVATVYESIALWRWQQAATSQSKSYQIYYLDPTIETTSTAAIMRREVSEAEADAAREFLDFLLAPAQQAVFVQHGFRPTHPEVDPATVPNSPWSQGITGVEVEPGVQIFSPPDPDLIKEINRLWERSQ
ncbi:MAG: ABC transporter substrate-binding protein, partial [Synechococcaceae cyanobacterium SM2_3_1]|nr:ABC transporter substrate-binding protein [Synechococcaceae cyanobacterium SM2_3_1]